MTNQCRRGACATSIRVRLASCFATTPDGTRLTATLRVLVGSTPEENESTAFYFASCWLPAGDSRSLSAMLLRHAPLLPAYLRSPLPPLHRHLHAVLGLRRRLIRLLLGLLT